MKLKVRKFGNALGVVLPKKMLVHLRVGLGDTLHASDVPGGVRLTASDPDFDSQMGAAREVMARRKRALRTLGKR